MRDRANYSFATVVVLFLVAGSFVSFTATNSLPQFTAANALFLAIAGLIALAGLVYSRWPVTGATGARIDPLAMVASAFVVWALVSSLASGRFASAFFGEPGSQVGLACLIALVCVGVYAAREADAVRRVLAYAMLALVVIQGTWTFLRPGDIVDAPHAGYANSSALGFALAIALPWLLSVPDAGGSRSNRSAGGSLNDRLVSWASSIKVRMFVAAIAVIAAFQAEARLALGLMLATLAWFAVARFVADSGLKRRLFVAAVAAGAIAAGLMMYLERAGRLPFGFLTIRYALWDTAVDAFARRPWLGYGADGFFSAGASVTVADPASGARPLIFTDGTTDPHNLIVFMAVCFGVLGLVLALGVVVGWVVRAGFRTRAFETFNPAFMSVAVGFVLLLTMPVSLDILPLYALFVGLSLAPLGDPEWAPIGPVGRVGRWAVLAFAALVLGVFGANAISRIQLGAVSYYAPAPFDRAVSSANVWSLDPYFLHQVNASFGGLILAEDSLPAAAGRWQAVRPSRAVALDTRNPYFALAYAQALWNAGRPTAEVVGAYQSAIEKYPSFPAAHADLALVYAQSGDMASARAELAAVYAVDDPAGYPWARTAALAKEAIDAGN